MENKKKKKKYEKPKVTRISLDAKTSVLGFCKASGTTGPMDFDCGFPDAPCSASGS